MSIILVQLILNKCLRDVHNVPKEMIDIVKDYLFENIFSRTKKYKKKMLSLITMTDLYLEQKLISEKNGILFLRILDGKKKKLFKCKCCNKCGDFEWSFEMTYYQCKCPET